MKKSIILIIILLFNFYTNAQPIDYQLKTPRSTLHAYKHYIYDMNDPANAAKCFAKGRLKQEELKEIAIKLRKILDARGLIIIPENAPDNSEYVDTATGEPIFKPFKSLPDVYLVKINNKWLFSEYTINSIDEIYFNTFPIETEKIRSKLPEFLLFEIIGLEIWQVLFILLYFVFGIIIYKIFKLFFLFLIKLTSKYIKLEPPPIHTIMTLSRSLFVLILLFILSNFLYILELSISINRILIVILDMLIPIFLTTFAYLLVDIIANYSQQLAQRTPSKVDDKLVPLIRKIFKIIVIISGFVYILYNLGIEITPILAGVSLGGLALALAAQETLKHFFGSVTVFTDRPFEIGDWIKFDNFEGTVEEVGLRSTRIRTFYNSVISIPNGKLSDMVIDNMGKRKYRRFRINIALTYDTPVDLIDAYVKGLQRIVLQHPATRKDYFNIYFNDMGEFSLLILFNIFFEVPDFQAELEARQQILFEIVKLAEHLGIRFAFPTNTIHVESFPQTKSLTPNYELDKQKIDDLLENYFKNKT